MEDQLQAYEAAVALVAETGHFPQQPGEVVELDDAMLTTRSKQSTIAQTTLPITNYVKMAWEEAHRPHPTRPLPLVPQVVRRGYHLNKDDLAFLGAVHRPDPLLESFCNTKDSKKGVWVLQGHKCIMKNVTFLHDVVQATVHTQRPLVHAVQAASMLRCLMFRLRALLHQQSELTDMVMEADTIAKFMYTASMVLSSPQLRGSPLAVGYLARPSTLAHHYKGCG